MLTIETAIVNDRPPSHTAGTLTPRAPDVQARMFEPFFTTRQGGTGLGLSSVAFTVAQLRGTIEVDSQPALGTTVVIHLPLARGSGARAHPPGTAARFRRQTPPRG